MKILKPGESEILRHEFQNLHQLQEMWADDASDAGIHQELWEDHVKLFYDQILQTGQYQRVSVCWGDFIRYPYSLLVRTSRDAVTH